MNDYSQPLYIQLKNSIRNKILSHEYAVGQPIPSERILSEVYGLNRMTVRKSIQGLIDEGLLVRVQGKGTYVKEGIHKVVLGANSRTSLSSSIQVAGSIPHRKVISTKIISDERFIELLGHSECIELKRVIYYDDVPYAYQKTYIPYLLFQDALSHDFSIGSLYDYMNSKGYMPTLFSSTLTVERKLKEVLDMLEIKEGKSIFFITYKGYTKEGMQVEYTESYHRPEYSSYKLVKYVSETV